ncbi:MAG: sialate O-acetylesterase [Fibrobacter sp.]|nr:sialate O-acetylesterase [Fibrobacter sp.]
MVYSTTKPKHLFGRLLAAIVLLSAIAGYTKTDVPVFLLAGQSNMTGYAASSGLQTNEKSDVQNVKIYMDLTWEGNASRVKKWLPLGINFGSGNANNGQSIGPELFFGRTLSDSMPGQKIALIKVSCGSTYLAYHRDDKGADDCWVPPSSNNGSAGAHYQRMISAIDAALKSFNTAYDTSLYTPRWAGFVWLQGEFDAYQTQYANAYEKNLTNLINDVRSALKITDLPVIIPMISTDPQWTYGSTVRTAEVNVTKKMKNVDTLETKSFPISGGHYTAPGQVKIGTIAAQRWLNMKYTYSPAVSVKPIALTTKQKQSIVAKPASIISLNGRQVIGSDYIHNGIFITRTESGIFRYSSNFVK